MPPPDSLVRRSLADCAHFPSSEKYGRLMLVLSANIIFEPRPSKNFRADTPMDASVMMLRTMRLALSAPRSVPERCNRIGSVAVPHKPILRGSDNAAQTRFKALGQPLGQTFITRILSI